MRPEADYNEVWSHIFNPKELGPVAGGTENDLLGVIAIRRYRVIYGHMVIRMDDLFVTGHPTFTCFTNWVQATPLIHLNYESAQQTYGLPCAHRFVPFFSFRLVRECPCTSRWHLLYARTSRNEHSSYSY
jgi:hypothetical protein